MKLTVERELRVENAFSGQIISVKTGEVTQENSELDPWLARTYARMYGYVLTKGEEGILISFDRRRHKRVQGCCPRWTLSRICRRQRFEFGVDA